MSEERLRDVLLRHGRVYGAVPDATAMLVVGGRVAWVGGEDAAAAADVDVDVVDLAGALVTPAFVDAHVHLTQTGLALRSLDLSGARSLAEALAAVARRAAALPPGRLLHGSRWDESRWPENRPPSADELEKAAPGRPVLLTRSDLHSAVASRAYLVLTPEVAAAEGCDRATGALRGDASALAGAGVLSSIGAAGRRDARMAALHGAAALGIAAVHEMGGPELGGEDDLRELLADCSRAADVPQVVAYWAEAGTDGVATAQRLGATPGGDLFADGSIGSGTALLRTPYADRAGSGRSYLTAAQVRDHVLACTSAGVQTSLHAIGDGALDVVLAGFAAAADVVGEPAIRRGRHRLEHAVMADPVHIERLARWGMVASVQPVFDATWGGPAGAYAARLGVERARRTHPLRALSAAGVPLAFGSDSPVTPLDPWGGVRAAVRLREPGSALSARAAFTAATRGGWRAAGSDAAGVLAPGSPATYAVWDAGPLQVQAPNGTVAAWSTDPRAGVAGLPDLSSGAPRCLRTVLDGRTLFSAS